MEEDVFELLVTISKNVNHKFIGVGGSSYNQRISDNTELKKYRILDSYGLINYNGDDDYTITEYGSDVVQHKSWEEYLSHIKELSERKVKKEKLDLIISEFQVRTRNLPFILSAIGILMSGLALYITISFRNSDIQDKSQQELLIDEKQNKEVDTKTIETNKLLTDSLKSEE